jgi:DNA polymerase III epsilon subunit family exonuclease
MSDILESLFDIDRSNPSAGIRISLKQNRSEGETEKRGNDELELADSPILRFTGSPAEVHLMNGRVVRESRHSDSQYSMWAPITGPADVEVEKKTSGRKKKNEPPVPLDQLEYVVVDVETTGGPQLRGHRITEIAIVRVDANGKKTHEYSTLINPGRSIPYPITKLTNISDAMVRRAPFFEDIAHEVRSLIEGRIFVAHNAAFDWGFIHGELVRTTGKPLLGRRLCTVRLARKVVPEVRRRTLDALSYFFNVHNEARHRAYGDARATARIFRRLLERIWEREIDSWQALDRFVRQAKEKRKRSALPTPIEDV